jgi:hypothetical protein
MLLLSDGTVMAANNNDVQGQVGNAWYQLAPDAFGHYVDGNWNNLPSMQYTRLFYSSDVLTNGSVFVAGGEYGTGGPTAEIYNPLASPNQAWTPVNPPAALINPAAGEGILDAESETLPDGTVLISPVNPGTSKGTLIFNPSEITWSPGPPTVLQFGEETFVKLPDGSILTIDPIITYANGVSGNGFGTNSERFIPGPNPRWVSDANLPVPMYATLTGYVGETGPGFLLPNGTAFFLGGAGHTAIYTPSPLGGTNAGSWVAGPDIPAGMVAADTSAAMMPNGKILCAVSQPPYINSNGKPQWPGVTYFYEYDYTDLSQSPYGSFTQTTAPHPFGPPPFNFEDAYSYQTAMLVLPDGNVLYSECGWLYLYIPDGSPVTAGKPVISTVTPNTDGSFHLTGTGLNGISTGSSYGDDLQNDTDYPIVKFTNLSDGTGHVNYGRTYNWSSTGVMTGEKIVTTEFTLPPGLIPDTYALSVVANGISSDPVTVYAPVWVDFNYNGSTQNGSYSYPFSTLAQGTNAVSNGRNIYIKTAGLSHETMTISKPMTIIAVGGPVTIGS